MALELRKLPELYALGAHVQIIKKDFGKAAEEAFPKLFAFLEAQNLYDLVVPQEDEGATAFFYHQDPEIEPNFGEPALVLQEGADLERMKKALETADNPRENFPEGEGERLFRLMHMKAGEWLVYTLKGSYSNLGEGWTTVFQQLERPFKDGKKYEMNCDLGCCYELYVKSCSSGTPEEEMITEIRVPVKAVQ